MEGPVHLHSRRGFLSRTLGASWTGASLLEQAVFRATAARAQAATAPASLFDIEKVADGIYAAIARPAALINCNAAIFENANDLLIVDTHSKGSAVAALVAQIRKDITTKPVRYVVNTHFHWDHTQGAPAYRRIAPHADIVSSAATRQLISELGAQRLKESVEQASKSLDDYQRQLSGARTAKDIAHWERMISESRAYITEMRNYAPELPNITFNQHLTLHDKAHELHLLWRGRGHTAGDVVVFCPEQRVIATGDLLHGFLPFLADGYPREWPRTLKSAGELAFDRVIGGHGAVQRTHERLGQKAAYITELTDAVARGKERGLTVEQLQREITPATLKSLASGGYGDFVAGQMIRYDASLELETPATALAKGLKENIASTVKALEKS
jgi:glyoxylase-like metal-dependent hydrolase (beta-lactamase superfamily II)